MAVETIERRRRRPVKGRGVGAAVRVRVRERPATARLGLTIRREQKKLSVSPKPKPKAAVAADQQLDNIIIIPTDQQLDNIIIIPTVPNTPKPPQQQPDTRKQSSLRPPKKDHKKKQQKPTPKRQQYPNLNPNRNPPKKISKKLGGSTLQQPKPKPKKTYKWEVKSAPEPITAASDKQLAPQLVKSATVNVFVDQESRAKSTEGMSTKERLAMYRKSAETLGTVDTSKMKARQDKNQKARPKMDKQKWNKAKQIIEKQTLKRQMESKELDALMSVEDSLFSIEQPDDEKQASNQPGNEGGGANAAAKSTTKPAILEKVNFNNNATLAKLDGKKLENAYKALVHKAKHCKDFSITNSNLNDRFVELLCEGALQPGANPKLLSINLESNKIGNPGIKLLALAIAELPNLRVIKLRHQLNKPSVEAQEAMLAALEKNTSIKTLSIDMKRELAQKRDKLESRNHEIQRKNRIAARQAAAAASSQEEGK
eukprot:CAMPEP_0197515270 /NCGR_PEP_ID=MMETSP1318-20131121/451_1 /TAXON_ID=552666 /ORGANISM="Partenskyella glossopodia, Strain RCC365" /LENGTH=483 /DNA_ID=CAMNT_0043063589 /DNA_START=60 /DNA_END=1510 /DNA_ORIENTATION=-